MAALRERLGRPGCFRRVADAVLEILGVTRTTEIARGT